MRVTSQTVGHRVIRSLRDLTGYRLVDKSVRGLFESEDIRLGQVLKTL